MKTLRAFTLLEVILAGVIFMIVAVSMIMFLSTTLRQASHQTQLSAARQVGQSVLATRMTVPARENGAPARTLTSIVDATGVPVIDATGKPLVDRLDVTAAERATWTSRYRPSRGFTVFTQEEPMPIEAGSTAVQESPETWFRIEVHVEWDEEDGSNRSLLLRGMRR